MNYLERSLPIALIGYIFFAIVNPRNYTLSSYKYVTLKELEPQLSTSLEPHFNRSDVSRPLCPALPRYGNDAINSIKQTSSFWSMDDIHFDEKILAQSLDLQPGGSWKPKHCIPVHHVSIIVPYRDRSVQLKKFVLYMHQFLQHQMIHYKITIVEQRDDLPFNRGNLFNIGFAEAVKQGWTQCFIFHDVDLLPESLYNIYGCTHRPRHMSGVVNTFRYTLQYQDLFGGAIAMTKDLFIYVNGFSNNFFGWGGEDDDLFLRLKNKNAEVYRLSPGISVYRMLPHQKAVASSARFDKLKFGKEHYDMEGLNSLKYSITNHIAGPLYTIIQVKLLIV